MSRFLSRYWFPMALVAVLVLAVPGLILFLLNLLGHDGPANRWLEDNFQLTYHVPLPGWSLLLLLLVPLAIVLLYFLKLKRKPLSVPSTFLWRKSIEDLHVNAFLQWLRQNVLLLLQILAVLAMIYGVMAFHLHGKTTEGKHYIIMIDNSASMSATDVLPSRLEWAKQEALKEIDAATDNDFGMVLEFNSSAEIKQSYTNNRNLLRDAVKHIEATQRTTRIDEALSLADSRANPVRSTEDVASRPTGAEPGKERTYVPTEGLSTEVHLYSDGRFAEVPEFALGNLNLHYHAAGKLVMEAATGGDKEEAKDVLKPARESSDNVALVALNASRDEGDPTKLRVFGRVLNFRTDPVDTQVQLEVSVNGELRGIREQALQIPARKVVVENEGDKERSFVRDQPGEKAVDFELSDLDERQNVVLHARLVKVNDRFPLDDEAWLVTGAGRKARVLIVGQPNEVLNAFFDDTATQEIAVVSRLSPDDLGKDAYLKGARGGAYDLVIFDRCGPKTEEDMPRANTMFIGYPPPPWKPDAVEKIEFPHIKGWMTKHRVLRYLTALHDVGLSEAFRMKDLPPRTPLLMETDRDTAVMLTLQRGGFTDLVMTFALVDAEGRWTTDWPKLPSFPLFLLNVLHALGNVPDTATDESIQPGQIKTIRPESFLRRIEVISPEGKEQTLTHDDREQKTAFLYGATDRVGVYRVQGTDLQSAFAVNLLDVDESNIEPRPEIQIGAERVATGQERSQPREVWKWFALLGLILLLLEWYIYNRRVYI